MITLTELSMKS